MSTSEATWHEIRPNGMLAISVPNPKRYPDRGAAEAAAAAMRQRYPDFAFIEIIRGKDRAETPVGRV